MSSLEVKSLKASSIVRIEVSEWLKGKRGKKLRTTRSARNHEVAALTGVNNKKILAFTNVRVAHASKKKARHGVLQTESDAYDYSARIRIDNAAN